MTRRINWRTLRPITPADRFWMKVDKKSDDECWNWTGAKNQRGEAAGSFWNGDKVVHAIRFAYEMRYGKIEAKKHKWVILRHSCDNLLCVNPLHLVLLGEKKKIEKVKKAKKKIEKVKKASSKLFNKSDVLEIRWLYEMRGMGQTEIAELFSLNCSTVYRIINNKYSKKVTNTVTSLEGIYG